MPDPVAPARTDEGLELQRALVEIALAPGPDEASPTRSTAPVATLLETTPALLIYRELVRTSLWDPVEAVFPISHALLGDPAWAEAREAFLAARAVRSRHYREIPEAFVGWLAVSGWGSATWPTLLPLAHFELVEVLVSLAPDAPACPNLAPEPSLDRRVRIHPSGHLLGYPFAVHRATLESPQPERAATHLLAFRGADDAFQLLDLTEATAALLARSQQEPLGLAIHALGLPDPPAALDLMRGLAHAGAILGFEP